MAPSTLEDYREILDRIFRPEIGRKAQSLTWSPPGRYPFSCAKNEKARQLAGFRVFWLGWQDSNLRMAGSKRSCPGRWCMSPCFPVRLDSLS
jgi:hypothetical protein